MPAAACLGAAGPLWYNLTMANLLIVERAYGNGSWALYRDGAKVASATFPEGLPRAPEWYANVVAGLAAAGVAPQALDLLLAGTGPGSFSGIRSVLAALQGLALPRGLPVLGLSSAAALARAVARARGAGTVAVVGDARRGTLWCTVYDVADNGAVTLHGTGGVPAHAASDFAIPAPDALAGTIPEGALVVSPEYTHLATTLQALSGAQVLAEEVRPSADDLAGLYFANPDAAVRDPLPIYLHPAVVVR